MVEFFEVCVLTPKSDAYCPTAVKLFEGSDEAREQLADRKSKWKR
jgi:hypothetical protein